VSKLSDLEHTVDSLTTTVKSLEDVVDATLPTASIFRAVRRQRVQAVDAHYYRTAAKVTGEWQYKDDPCDCHISKSERQHNKIRFKNGNAWYVVCPVRYYLLLAWKAITEKTAVPSIGLYNKLLQKDIGEQKS
jgi:hypothetical protein